MMKRVLLLTLLFCCVLFCAPAHAELAQPQTPSWQAGSAATAVWEAVEGADYYLVTVHVYCDGVELGTMQTGTAATELDVQQEIHNIAGTEYDHVEVCFSVTAQYTDPEGNVSNGPASVLSDKWAYSLLLNLLPPQDITLSDDGTVRWKLMRDDGYYQIHIYLGVNSGGYQLQESVFAYQGEFSENDGFGSFSIAENIQRLIDGGSETRHVAVSMQTYVDTHGTIHSSPNTFLSNGIEWIDPGWIQPQAPDRVTLSDEGICAWTHVENADAYELEVWLSSGENGYDYQRQLRLTEQDYSVADGVAVYDLAGILPALRAEYEPDVISSQYFVHAIVKTICVYDQQDYISEGRDKEGTYQWITPDALQLQQPQNIALSQEGILSWDQVTDAQSYKIAVHWGAYPDMFILHRDLQFDEEELTADGDRRAVDLSSLIESVHAANQDSLGDVYYVCVSMRSCATVEEQNFQSLQTDLTGTTEFRVKKPVETLTLSPAAPVLYLGNSLYLGKTITPADAYYTHIDWSSANSGIATVDTNGCMTGVAPGTTEITAAIGDASCTVPVTVYTISSNIEDDDDKEAVTDNAGSIIDDIVNGDDPDIGSTDIPQEDLDEVRDQVQEGIWRGDTFFTDMKWYEETFAKYKNNWGQIQKAARELNAQFAGAYNIVVEMYHKDQDGADHRIGCIEELENEISFAFDLPTGMNEIKNGYARKYVLVRVHRNEMEPIEVAVEDGRYSAKSDCFSDFILLYVDELLPPVDLTGLHTLTLPDSLQVLEQEALSGVDAEVIVIPLSCTTIGSRAFANCPKLKYIVFSPDSETVAAEDAYEDCSAEILYQ